MLDVGNKVTRAHKYINSNNDKKYIFMPGIPSLLYFNGHIYRQIVIVIDFLLDTTYINTVSLKYASLFV